VFCRRWRDRDGRPGENTLRVFCKEGGRRDEEADPECKRLKQKYKNIRKPSTSDSLL
jgi:hypothetical protein